MWDIFNEASKAPPPTNGDVVIPPHTDEATKTNPAIENETTETKNETTQQVPQDDNGIKKKKAKKLKRLTNSEDPIVCDVLNDVSMDSETVGKKKKKKKKRDLISKPKRKHISDDTEELEELDIRTKKRKIEN